MTRAFGRNVSTFSWSTKNTSIILEPAENCSAHTCTYMYTRTYCYIVHVYRVAVFNVVQVLYHALIYTVQVCLPQLPSMHCLQGQRCQTHWSPPLGVPAGLTGPVEQWR